MLPKPGTESASGAVSTIAPRTAYTVTTAAPSPIAAAIPRDRVTIQDPAGSLVAKLMLKTPRDIRVFGGPPDAPKGGSCAAA
jgi:hypothetical protein